jgi:hypothetical protein
MVEIDLRKRLAYPLAFLPDRPVNRGFWRRVKPDRDRAHLKGPPIGGGVPNPATAVENGREHPAGDPHWVSWLGSVRMISGLPRSSRIKLVTQTRFPCSGVARVPDFARSLPQMTPAKT